MPFSATHLSGLTQSVVTLRPDRSVRCPHLQLRTTMGARIRLGVKSTVTGIMVFARAGRAHGELPHGRVRTVVRQRFEDAETGTAIRAVREWVAVTPVGRFNNVPQAIGAGGDVRQNQDRFWAPLVTEANLEPVVADRVEKGKLDTLEHGARRLF